MGQTESIKIDEHKYNELREVLKRIESEIVEHIVPNEIVDMHEDKKAKAE